MGEFDFSKLDLSVPAFDAGGDHRGIPFGRFVYDFYFL